MLLSKSSVATAGFGVGAAVFFVGGLVLLCMGVLGEYIGRVYDEVRSRPLSIINSVHASPMQRAHPVGMIAVQGDNYQNRNATEAA
jgi:dolichol-phosphate mannosyltransferase